MKLCPRCSELFSDDAAFCPHDGAELQKSNDRFLGRTIASRYRLIRRLGAGGMSVVYLARHELIARLSALKILRPELSLIAEHRERFLREARAVNRINHENIVEITDVGESDGVAYLVMEYVEGEGLLSWIQRGRLPWERALKIGMQVASALARAHQMGVIHRDLKPENILLLPRTAGPARAEVDVAADPNDVMVKLTDFGIAKMSGEPTLTLNEQLFGTPGYIAPEYVGGIGIDGRSDIYSLAVVVYEMVTGVLPFDGKGQSELLLKPLTNPPIPPSQRVDGLPPDLESLLLRCLAREPNDRPHDAFAVHDAFADILRRYGSGGSRTSSPPRLSNAPRISVPPRASSPPEQEKVEREPSHTVVDLVVEVPSSSLESGSVQIVAASADAAARWSESLTELEDRIAEARRKGGEHAVAAGRAAELAMVAGEMMPRVERATKIVGDLQAKVDLLEARGREFRTNLGHAIDVLVHDRSREIAHLDAIAARRDALARPAAGFEGQNWEDDALAEEERRAHSVVDDLTFQIDSLQKQLDAKNEAFERDVLEASATFEGSLSAFRRLTTEVVRTIEEGVSILDRVV
ncbi:Serine/threonine protein kinase PrkC, regulator of stationary phase [Labilithrix luteola]|uniref:Serine/threonine protein kinase PrkC, regulator of stationary phase n=1 Tax=Labilithrix luteola TaxID=1391654 RepID=A0A0K1QCY3_9BACT|nr:serine/threonine-protein kinase [Labilithrix luteola]AKV03588.1 Serine/threonine protein kinase PrkC, regulator of stationary phase [Labilithrix luteola]